MTWSTILNDKSFCSLADACNIITGLYPSSISELKTYMLGYDKSLLLKNI